MNQWECSEPGCKNTAVGVGGAIGLRAIGWYFVPRPWGGELFANPHNLYCPSHRPDAQGACVEFGGPDPCPSCTGGREAMRWQRQMGAKLGVEMPDDDLYGSSEGATR